MNEINSPVLELSGSSTEIKSTGNQILINSQ